MKLMAHNPLAPHFDSLESRQMLAVDLTVQLLLNTTGSIEAGTLYQAPVTVTNSGEALPEIPVRVRLFASPGSEYNPAMAVMVGGATLAGSPRFGEATPLSVPFIVPTTVASGAYSLFALVDPERIITEADENNNFSEGVAVTVTGGSAGGGENGPIDLTSLVTLANPQIIPNTPVTVTVSITNRGTGTVSAAGTFVQLFLAKGQNPSPNEDLLLGTRVTGALGPEGTDTGEMQFTLTPEQATGAIRLYAVADLSNLTAESDETNNFSAVATGFGIGGVSDLTGIFVSEKVPDSMVQGQKAKSSTYKLQVRNAGDYPVSRGTSVMVRAYLRPLLDASGAGDIAVSSAKKVSVSNLKPDRVKSVSLSVKPPTGLDLGDYWVIVKIDDTNVLSEFSESNNTIDTSTMFSVVEATRDPGFTDGSLSFRGPVTAGKSGSVKLTMNNLGNSDFKERVTVQIFFRDASGVEIAAPVSYSKNLSVKAGRTTRVGSIKIKAPEAAGEYTIGARLILPEGVVDAGLWNNTWDVGTVTVAV